MPSVLGISGKIERKLLRLAFSEQWVIGARRQSAPGLPEGIEGCALLQPPLGRHYADPFVIAVNSRPCVFFEAWGDGHRKGVILFSTLESNLQWSSPQLALERPYHLSYPFVFAWKGDLYLLPETSHNRTIELYRAVEFPQRWTQAAVLMENVDALDTTLFAHDGRWWMFTAGLGDGAARYRSLWLFHAPSPLGPWQPHPSNPVLNNLGTARPAGHLFSLDGQLIRPGQDCRWQYGHAISWNRVERLDEHEYQETCIAKLRPNLMAGWAATHTFNQDGEWQVLDGKRLVSRFADNHSIPGPVQL
ncbi:MAG: hypothetical protein ACM3PW_17635 [Chlamydiota bacterium]